MAILLHTCCSPCACHPVEYLGRRNFNLVLFFYNPNIHPRSEYDSRLNELKKYLKLKPDVGLINADYDTERWFELVKGLEKEPEKGKRCDICYQMRLEHTAQVAAEHKFEYFGSTLSISPHKKANIISQIGQKLAVEYSIKFYDQDWKKQGGFQNSCKLSKKYGFYRQNYCGCAYSRKNDII